MSLNCDAEKLLRARKKSDSFIDTIEERRLPGKTFARCPPPFFFLAATS